MFRVLICLVVSLSLLFASNDTTTINLKTVTITSSKRIESKFNLPQSIEIIQQKDFLFNSSNNIYDVTKNISGVTFASDGVWGVSPLIRGLSPNNSHIYIDGIKIETATEHAAAASLINLNDIEKIEILKGAVNSYYGSGAIGGIIYIISSQPKFTENFAIKSNFNSYYQSNNNLVGNDLSFFLSNNNFAGKISYGQRIAENAKNSKQTIANSAFKDKYAATQLNYKYDNLLLSTNLQYYFGDDVGIPGAGNVFPTAATVYYDKVIRKMANFTVTYNSLSDYIPYIKLKLSMQDIERYVVNIPNVSQTTAKAKITTENILPVGLHSTKYLNLESIFKIDNQNNIVYGVDIWQRNLETRRERNIRIDSLNPDKSIFKTVYRYQFETPIPKSYYTSYGLWFSYKNSSGLIENLSNEIAGRVDYVKINNDYAETPSVDILDGKSILNPTRQIKWDEKKSDNTSWSLSLNNDYKVFDDYKIALNISRTYRIPTIEERYQYIEQGTIVKLGNTELKPEEGTYFELVQKFANDNISSNLSLYRYDFKNLVSDEFRKKYFVRSQGDTLDAFVKVNIGEAYLMGSEYDFTISKVLDLFNIYTNVTYIIGKDKNTKKYLPKMPPLYGRFALEILPISSLSILYSIDFAAKAVNSPSSEPLTAGYGISNILINYSFDLFSTKLNLVAGCNNIFDKLYKNHLSTYRGYFQYEMGRNIYAKLRVEI
ncbi:MAG TPA: TonB-dependent receptor [Ignavibacteriales bacterium]|nr:TonB-dependent receptor [Ignavibacteriales bacterium]HOL80366.1 TonB-dependent receptor [Ignavibacteriales bacterium]HPD67450.1 TonB-dependent receptor [Ignavibacteriales bacterium]HPP32555.1 TonB-dependent receptor [Ignavibacteriales bacterium]HRR17478.1 TonB-dependent receptor [Ignavibacteriales bacterium]